MYCNMVKNRDNGYYISVKKKTGYFPSPIPQFQSSTNFVPNYVNEHMQPDCVHYTPAIERWPVPVHAAFAQPRVPHQYDRQHFLHFPESAHEGNVQYPLHRDNRPQPGSLKDTKKFVVRKF